MPNAPSDQVLRALRAIVDYDLPTEEGDYARWLEENGGIDSPDNGHIIHALRAADAWLQEMGA